MGKGTAPEANGVRRRSMVRMIGFVGWVVIFGAFLAWEGLGLAIGHEWPTLSHMMRTVTRSGIGRWIAFGFWLWLGWHLFVRGWHFFLRGQLPEPSQGSRHGLSFGKLWAQAILPLVGTYVLLLGGLRLSSRRRTNGGAERTRPRPVSWQLVLFVGLTVAIGYAFFVGMVGMYVVLTGQNSSALFTHALTGGAALAFVVVWPGFVVISWLQTSALRSSRRP